MLFISLPAASHDVTFRSPRSLNVNTCRRGHLTPIDRRPPNTPNPATRTISCDYSTGRVTPPPRHACCGGSVLPTGRNARCGGLDREWMACGGISSVGWSVHGVSDVGRLGRKKSTPHRHSAFQADTCLRNGAADGDFWSKRQYMKEEKRAVIHVKLSSVHCPSCVC